MCVAVNVSRNFEGVLSGRAQTTILTPILYLSLCAGQGIQAAQHAQSHQTPGGAAKGTGLLLERLAQEGKSAMKIIVACFSWKFTTGSNAAIIFSTAFVLRARVMCIFVFSVFFRFGYNIWTESTMPVASSARAWSPYPEPAAAGRWTA
jgi:hypothetical protein